MDRSSTLCLARRHTFAVTRRFVRRGSFSRLDLRVVVRSVADLGRVFVRVRGRAGIRAVVRVRGR
ncbi:MAG: hypothetical protein WD638_11795, partial [Nitriliruptoraceae bacterium]